MTKPLTVLHLEDDSRDAELVQQLLRAGNIACDITRVDNQADFTAALEQPTLDLILADHSLPGFDGLAALTLAHQAQPRVPFIFVTGTLGEEVAIEALKTGATDYVLKHRLTRLIPVVRRALEEAEGWKKRAQMEEALRDSEERYRTIVEDQTEFIARFTLDGVLTFINSAYSRYIGATPEQLTGQNLLAFAPEEERLTIQRLLKTLTPTHPTVTYVRQVSRPDEGARHQEWTARALFDAAGRTVECQIVGRDVTERVQAEEALRRQAALIELSPVGIIVRRLDGVITFWSRGAEALYGWTRQEALGRTTQDLLRTRFPIPLDEITQQLRQSGRWAGELIHRAKDGREVVVQSFWQGQFDDQGEVVELMESNADITQRKQVEEALQQSERFLDNIVENIPNMIFVKDAQELKFVRFNKAGEELLGLSRQDLYGKTDFDIMPEPIAAQYVAKDREVLRDKQFLDIPEEPTQTRPRGLRILHTKKIPLLDETGQPQFLLGIAEDITERKQAEEQIRRQVATLSALYAGAQQLAASLDSLQLAEDVARTCVEAFGLALAWVGRAEPDGRVQILTQFPLEHTYLRLATLRWDDTPEGRGITGQAIRSGSPVVLANLMRDPQATPLRKLALAHGFHSIAAFPLVTRHQPFGALVLYSEQPEYFTPERVQFFQSYALQAAAALENARLFEQTERRLSHMQALRRIDTAISSSLDRRITLDVILDQATTQLRADAAGILLFDPHTHLLHYAAGRGFRSHATREAHLRLGEGYAGQAALERRTVVNDTGQSAGDGPLAGRYRALMEAEGFVTHVATPLVAKGQVVGVLEVFHRSGLNTNGEWLDFLAMLAGQAAIAIDSAALFEGLQRSNIELELAYDATLEGWSHALDLRDRETEGHTLRVTELTEQLARAMGLDAERMVHVRRGALLHDIGKMGIPDSILLKPGPLTEEERAIMCQHPQYAYDLLSPIKYLRAALDIPYAHHEKWDGTGYPRGLKATEIPLSARLFAVVDVWDALRSDRPYRKAWPAEQVREHIRSLAGTHFDPQVVEAFIDLESNMQPAPVGG